MSMLPGGGVGCVATCARHDVSSQIDVAVVHGVVWFHERAALPRGDSPHLVMYWYGCVILLPPNSPENALVNGCVFLGIAERRRYGRRLLYLSAAQI